MNKFCLSCSQELVNRSKQWSNQKYCSAKCRKNHHRMKKTAMTRVERKRSNLTQNDEMLYLIRQCKQAGTVQVLHGHDLKSFKETMELIKARPKGDVNLCHIAPVKGTHSTGLLHHRNLFYGGAYQNKKFGNKYISGGLSISNAALKRKWRVTRDMSNNDVLIKIEEFLLNVIPDYIKSSPVRKSKKVQIAKKITDVDPSANFDELMFCSYKELCDSWSAISGRLTQIPESKKESKYLAYMDSLTRFIDYGGVRAITLRKLRRIMVIAYMALERVELSQTYNKYFYVKYEPLVKFKYGQAKLKNPDDWPILKDLVYTTAFQTLQGASLKTKAFQKLVLSYLELSDNL